MLTPRQREVAELVAKGNSYRRVARTLGISQRTVVNHVQAAASRIDNITADRPRDRLIIWFLTVSAD